MIYPPHSLPGSRVYRNEDGDGGAGGSMGSDSQSSGAGGTASTGGDSGGSGYDGGDSTQSLGSYTAANDYGGFAPSQSSGGSFSSFLTGLRTVAATVGNLTAIASGNPVGIVSGVSGIANTFADSLAGLSFDSTPRADSDPFGATGGGNDGFNYALASGGGGLDFGGTGGVSASPVALSGGGTLATPTTGTAGAAATVDADLPDDQIPTKTLIIDNTPQSAATVNYTPYLLAGVALLGVLNA